MGRRGYPPEFRRRDVATGMHPLARPIVALAADTYGMLPMQTRPVAVPSIR